MRKFVVYGSGIQFSFGPISQQIFIAIESSKPPVVSGEHIVTIPESDYLELKDKKVRFEAICTGLEYKIKDLEKQLRRQDIENGS